MREVSLAAKIPENNYIKRLDVVRHIDSSPIVFDSPVTFFVGENGVGKSTLIEAIAISLGFNAEGGSRNFTFSTVKSHSDLYKYIRVTKGIKRRRDGYFLRAESYFNVATDIDERDSEKSFDPPIIESYGGVSLHNQSHGESFMALVRNRFGGDGIYILDEPEAALSPMSQFELICELDRLTKIGSQFIISTHSPILMAFPGAKVYEITKNGITDVKYYETEHYRLTKRFLSEPDKMLKNLFKEE